MHEQHFQSLKEYKTSLRNKHRKLFFVLWLGLSQLMTGACLFLHRCYDDLERRHVFDKHMYIEWHVAFHKCIAAAAEATKSL